MGGIIGRATGGSYTVENVVFAGVLGHTDNNLTPDYAHSESGKTLQVGQVIGNQNWKSATVTNVLGIGTVVSGRYGSRFGFYGQSDSNDTNMTRVNCLTAKEDADFLTENTAYANAGWVYDADLGYVLPQSVLDMLK